MTVKKDLIINKTEIERKLLDIWKKFKKTSDKIRFLKSIDKKEIKNLVNEYKENLLEILFATNILSKEEYQREYKNKYIDEQELDSFMQYMDCLLHQILEKENIIFVTLNKKMLKDRAFLEERFGIEILLPKEAIEGRKTTYFIGE